MKFGKDLEQYKHPGWEEQYINYRELKNILRKLEEPGAVKDEVDGEFFQALDQTTSVFRITCKLHCRTQSHFCQSAGKQH